MTTLSLAPHPVSFYGFNQAVLAIRRTTNVALARASEAAVMDSIRRVGRRSDNWDSCGSDAPQIAAVDRASSEVRSFLELATKSDLGWQQPLVGSNEYGEVSFEWWRQHKKLTVYVGPVETNFVCSWGDDIGSMDAGVLETNQFLAKWRWLVAQ